MNQNERATNNPSSKGDASKSAVLPTENSPASDPVASPKRDGGIKPGQPEVAGKGKDAAASDAKDGSPIKAPADKPWNDGNTG